MVRNPRRPLADRVYDARSLRDELAARRIKAVIPPSPTRKHARTGRHFARKRYGAP